MSNLIVTRWATYLLPGTILLLAIGITVHSADAEFLKGHWPDKDTPLINGILGAFAFLAVSYVIGIGLWGLCYSRIVQRCLFRNPHSCRIREIQKRLNEDWFVLRGSNVRSRFPITLRARPADAKNAYMEFEHGLVLTYFLEKKGMLDRIRSERDTISLLQALIVSTLMVAIALLFAYTQASDNLLDVSTEGGTRSATDS